MSILDQILPKKDTGFYFLTLGMGEHHIRAAVALLAGTKIKLIGIGESEFSQDMSETEAIDIAISMAEKDLAENILVEKVIFALPETFLRQGDVKPEHLGKLKIITKELNLKPVGFIDYPSSIAYQLEKEEGSPPTVLLFALERQNISISFVRLGKIYKNYIFPRSTSISQDFSQFLPKFHDEVLPPRIILYDETEKLEEIKEELLRFPWHKYVTIYHTPKIEIFSGEKMLTALVESAASTLQTEKDSGISTLAHELSNEEKTQPSSEVSEPIHKEIKKDHHEKVEQEPQPDVARDETFGFVHEDIANIQPGVFEEDKKFKKSQPITQTLGEKLQKIKAKLPVFPRFKLPRLPVLFLPPLLLPISLILLIFISFGLIAWVYPKTKLVLIVYPLVQNKNIEVSFKINTDNLSSNNKDYILVRNSTDEISGEKTIATTGKNKIGEKAKGEVSVYNKTVSNKTLPKGTVLQASDLQFIIDDDISIASASDTGEGLAFGKTTARVTAANIGPEYNMPSGLTFTLKDFPDTSYNAKSTKEFTGGTSRDISSVSNEDQVNLENLLLKELTLQLNEKTLLKLASGEKLLTDTQVVKVKAKQFSSEVGAEAKELSLTMTLSADALAYKESDLLDQGLNAADIPDGFTLDKLRTSFKLENVKVDNDDFTSNVIIKFYFTPVLDLSELGKTLTGKTYVEAEKLLRDKQYIAGFKIIETNKLPLIKNRLPFRQQNLQLQIQSI